MSTTTGSARKPYNERTDHEVREELRAICTTSHSDDEVRRRIREDLGYPYGDAALTSTSHGPLYMCMVMIHGPSGKTISA